MCRRRHATKGKCRRECIEYALPRAKNVNENREMRAKWQHTYHHLSNVRAYTRVLLQLCVQLITSAESAVSAPHKALKAAELLSQIVTRSRLDYAACLNGPATMDVYCRNGTPKKESELTPNIIRTQPWDSGMPKMTERRRWVVL